ncbi:MAG: DnaJ domain-containing protein, partial [Rhizobiaceae bacterium]
GKIEVTYLFGFFLVLLLVASSAAILLTVPAHNIASALKSAIPFSLIFAGAALTLVGRAGLGIPLGIFGLTLWRRGRSVSSMGNTGSTPKSTVRSAMFEMELDHDTGDMDGTVLTGNYEGRRLSSLDEQELLELLTLTGQDAESAALLEAYLDRRVSGWRDDAQPDSDARHAGTASSGPMTKEEAYQILGLAPGASANDVRKAHRRLMKRVHPDGGGSTFLASKINEAKDILLN